MELSLPERKVLTLLEEDGRLPAKQIAKKVRLSPEGVIRMMERLRERGVIVRYSTKVDYARMGYVMYPVHIKLLRRNEQVIRAIRKTIPRHHTCAWYTFAEGEYDLLLSFKIASESDTCDMAGLLDELSDHIQEKDVSIVLHAFEIGKSFVDTGHPQKLFATFSHELEAARLSDEEVRLINCMRSDSRRTMLDLSREVGMSARAVSSRVKRLKEGRVISGFKTKVNMARLGYQPCIAFLKLGRHGKKEMNTFMTYCRYRKGINYLVQQIGMYDIGLTIDVADINDFYVLMDEMRDRFPFIIKITTMIAKESW